MNCPDCGMSLEEDAKFCPKCYAIVESPGLWRRVLNYFRSASKPGVHVLKSQRKVNITTVGKDGTRHEYHSIDEVPPAMRSQLEGMEMEMNAVEARLLSPENLASIPKSPGLVSRKSFVTYKVKDASGRE